MLNDLIKRFSTPPTTGRYAMDERESARDANRQTEAMARAVEDVLFAAIPQLARGDASSLVFVAAGATYTITRA